MASPKVLANVGSTWTNVIGAASGVANVTWQNIGNAAQIQIAFTTAAPAGSATDAYHILNPGDGYLDVTGSTACWVRCLSSVGGTIAATAA